MTAFSLPRIQAANPPASADSSKDIAAGNSAADSASFQQVLAKQAQKAKPEAPAEKPAQPPAAQNKPAESAKNDNTTEQAEAGATEATVPDAKPATPDADALALLGLPAADATAADKDETVAADQLPGLPTALPFTGLVDTQAQLKKPRAEATALRADVGDALQHRSRAQPDADLTAKNDLKTERHAGAKIVELAANVIKQPHAADDHAQQPDFAKLLADKALPATPAVAPVVANAVQAAAANSNVIALPLGSKGWDQAVSQKVVWMVGGMEQSATLTLNPPDLGPLQVVIHVHNDQANTTFVSDNPEVRQALQDSIATLRSMLGNSGIQLGDTNISAGNQAQQQFQQASRQGGGGQQQAGQQLHTDAPATRVYGGSGLVDTFA